MSTDYHLYCQKCDQYGGLLTRQAGFVGNFDIIETFKFAMLHILECGEDHARFVSEHHLYDLDKHIGHNSTLAEEFLAKTRDIRPQSNDWEIITRNPERFDRAMQEWGQEFRNNIEEEE